MNFRGMTRHERRKQIEAEVARRKISLINMGRYFHLLAAGVDIKVTDLSILHAGDLRPFERVK